MTTRSTRILMAAWLVLLSCAGCCRNRSHGQDAGGAAAAGTPTSTAAGPELPVVPPVEPARSPELVIGTYALAPDAVVDGDTLKVEGLERSLRLLSLDTEEVGHLPEGEEPITLAAGGDFGAYVEEQTRGQDLPVKYPTPAGEAARVFAERFFAGVREVRLERDFPGQAKDTYGRHLCHVWALYADGRPPALYNLEAIRQGHSPYFVKYGRSRRFDEAFRAAQAQARAAKRGIWDPGVRHYPDYEERSAWWERRAEALARYEQLAVGERPPVRLGGREGIYELFPLVGERVRVFGVIDDHDPKAVVRHEGGATLRLGGKQYYIEVEVVGRELASSLDVDRLHGEFVLVSGVLDREGSPLKFGRKKDQRFMRIPVTEPGQLIRGHLIPTR